MPQTNGESQDLFLFHQFEQRDGEGEFEILYNFVEGGLGAARAIGFWGPGWARQEEVGAGAAGRGVPWWARECDHDIVIGQGEVSVGGLVINNGGKACCIAQ